MLSLLFLCNRLGVTPKVDQDRDSSKGVTSSRRDVDAAMIIQEGRVPALPMRTQTQQVPTSVPSTYEIIDVDTDDDDVDVPVAPPRALHARTGTPAAKNPFHVSTSSDTTDIDFSLIPPKYACIPHLYHALLNHLFVMW